MKITKTQLQALKENLNNNSLGHGEVRRLVGMGGRYIAHQNHALTEGYTLLFSVVIENVPYCIYRKQ